MLRSRYAARAIVSILFTFVIMQMAAPSALGQADFVIQASTMNPSSVDPGQPSISTITVNAVNTVNPANVILSCAITKGPSGSPPTCAVSPSSVTTPASPTLTVSTTGATVPGLYVVTVTGSDASGNLSATTTLNVVAVSPQFTLSVASTVSPTSVHAGAGASAVISIVPANGYGGTGRSVTLACSNTTPVVTLPPVCTFLFNGQPQTKGGVPITTSVPVPVTLNITTTSPTVPTAALPRRGVLYALWFPVAGLALIGFGSCDARRRRFLALFLLLIVAAGLLLAPACGPYTPPAPNATNSTPNNTYTITITGTDNTGQTASNATDVTVSLIVD